MILLDLINMRKIRKAVIYLFCIILTLWLQTMVFSRVEILGVKPLFVPALAVAVGLWEGGVWGGVLGLVTGILCDLSFSDTTALFTVLLPAFGFFAGLLADHLINRRFVACFILSAAALLFTALCQIVPLWIFRGTPLGALLPTALLQAAWALPFTVPAYLIAKRISGRGRSR